MKRILIGAALAAFSFCASAQISDETARHLATMKAQEESSKAIAKLADAVIALSARVNGTQQPVFIQAPQVEKEKDCTGFGGCMVAGVKGVFTGLRDFAVGTGQALTPLTPFANMYFGHQTSKLQYAYQAKHDEQTTAQEQSRQGTLQYAFGAQRDVGVSAITRPDTPTTLISHNTGPVSAGGTQNNSSFNPITNPAPVVVTCTPVIGTNGVATGTSCTRSGG